MKLSALFHDPELRARVAAYERDATERVTNLTRQQTAILTLIIEGHPNKVIAYKLGLSIRTIENHRAEIYDRTRTTSPLELLRFVIASDLAD